MSINLKSLIGRLNDTTRATLEAAAGLCLSRTHYDIEPEHFLLKLLDKPDSDVSIVLKHFGVDKSKLTVDLSRSLDKLKSGNARTPAISPSLLRALTEGWTIGSLNYSAGQVRSGFVLLALLSEDDLSRLLREISPREFDKINLESLRKDFFALTQMSSETASPLSADGGITQAVPGAPVPGGKTPHLDQYTTNLTENARKGKIDPVLGRDTEIRQIIDILMRRRQNNPILTGEAGVGKTAVVEGFALRVANGDVPPPLKRVKLHSLDLALLQAGAGVKGEFENRLKGLIEEVKSSPSPIILFIDEAHTMIGAGGQAGQNDAANLLKPALARGELRTIAATTWAEYKKYFEKDAALARRFQVVKVEEPDEAKAIAMMRGLAEALENHHRVRILAEAVEDAVRLSHRYISGRQLPDKSVSVLDTACARVAIGQGATPASVEDAQRRIDQLTTEINALEREAITGVDHAERLEELKSAKTAEEARLANLKAQWEREREIIEQVRDVRTQLEEHAMKRKEAASGNGHGDGAAAAATATATAPAQTP